MATTTGSRIRRRESTGYLLVPLASVLFGVVGTIPFVLAGYAVVQLVLAPLGLARADSSNNDGTGVLLVSGGLVPVLLLAGWGLLLRWLIRRYDLAGATAWVSGLLALALPTFLFATLTSV